MKNKYSISSYNKHICLKVDYVMWFIFLFLLKPYVILIFSFANIRKPMELIESIYPDKFIMSITALIGIPTAFLIYALSRREPEASTFVRFLWNKGTKLLTITTILNGIVILIPLILKKTTTLSLLDWIQFILCILILVTLYSYDYIKDCFADFPTSNN